MPVRDKAEVDIIPLFAGPTRSVMGQITGALALSREEFEDVSDFVTELFVATMEAVDFNRVILEAGGMCSEKQTADPDHRPKVRGVYADDSLIREPDPDFNMEMTFCPDCFRLCILRLEKWRVMEQEDVKETLPEDHAPEGFALPEQLAGQFARWVRRRKESWK